MRFPCIALVAIFVTLHVSDTSAAPTNDGLFADIETSMGTIGMELYFTNAPRTVANFISLAEGTRSWVNFAEGGVSSNDFYSGIIFHRVITNFIIQAGSPNKMGTDGPGYVFNDEFDASLTHGVGALSMANSGPNSNGSQFFITVEPTPGLDNVHTIFGQVISGMHVVSNISEVAVNGSARPLSDVTISNVVITRNGNLATAFSATNVIPHLPHVRAKASEIRSSGSNLVMHWNQTAGCQYWILGNTDIGSDLNWFSITTWSGAASNITVTSLTQSYQKFFFTTVEVEY